MKPLAAVSDVTGLIFNVQRFCIEDGPGIRTTIFFKGCPLRCPWCHNPEGIPAEPQIVFNESRCIHCLGCIEACVLGTGDLTRISHQLPAAADDAPCPAVFSRIGMLDGLQSTTPRPSGRKPHWTRRLAALAAKPGEICGLTRTDCKRCGSCADGCPTRAREMVGRKWTVDEVRSLVLRDQIFYDSLEGGVTFSGGEPLRQPEFLIACLQACRNEGVHTTLDTCGFGSRDRLLVAAELIDLVLFDLKILDADEHLSLLGVPLAPILANLDALSKHQQRIWLRIPIIPGITDTKDNLRKIRELATATPNIEKICLLPYHKTGVTKHLNVNQSYALESVSPPSDEHMLEVAALFSGAVSEVVIGG